MVVNDGVVFTKSWVVSMMLRICDYHPDKDLAKLRVLEPSCGDGAFLSIIVQTLCESAKRFGHSSKVLSDSILAFDLDPEKVANSRSKVFDILLQNGYSVDDSRNLSEKWIKCDDFLLTNKTPSFDIVIGNPPYIKSSEINSALRELYIDNLETMTKGTDIFVGFIEAGLNSLKKDGKLCYICADRWMQNSYGKKLRKFILTKFHMDLICRMHEVDAFEDKVDAYPAIILINNSPLDTIFVDCTASFSSLDVDNLLDSINGVSDGNNSTFKQCSIPSFDITGGPWLLTDSKSISFIGDFEPACW